MFFRFVIISFVVIQVSYAQITPQQELNQETLLRQQQARIQRQVERDKLQKEIASEKLDLLSDFQEKEDIRDDKIKEPQICFKLKSITYQNSTILSKRQKLKLSKGFIGRCITPKLLTQITRNVTNFYIDRGYVTTRAFVNPQNIKTGRLEILIMEGKLESIEFDSDIKNFFTLSQITHAFGRIKGKILNIRDIEQGLDQLNRLSSNNATMKIVPSQKQGYSKIIISKNKQSRTTRVRLGANNSGQKQTGLYNGKIILEQDNLLKLSDSIYAVYTHDLADRSDDRNSKNLYTSINVPFGYWNFSTSYIDSTYLNTIQGTNTTIKTSGKSTFNTFKVERKIFRNKKNKIIC
jgi:hemolysin activation/secretion protein